MRVRQYCGFRRPALACGVEHLAGFAEELVVFGRAGGRHRRPGPAPAPFPRDSVQHRRQRDLRGGGLPTLGHPLPEDRQPLLFRRRRGGPQHVMEGVEREVRPERIARRPLAQQPVHRLFQPGDVLRLQQRGGLLPGRGIVPRDEVHFLRRRRRLGRCGGHRGTTLGRGCDRERRQRERRGFRRHSRRADFEGRFLRAELPRVLERQRPVREPAAIGAARPRIDVEDRHPVRVEGHREGQRSRRTASTDVSRSARSIGSPATLRCHRSVPSFFSARSASSAGPVAMAATSSAPVSTIA